MECVGGVCGWILCVECVGGACGWSVWMECGWSVCGVCVWCIKPTVPSWHLVSLQSCIIWTYHFLNREIYISAQAMVLAAIGQIT